MLPVRPLRSTGVTPLLSYYGPLRLPAGPPRSYAFPRSVGRFRARPNRASQAPRLICPRALSPTTPEGPMTAYACCFATGLVWLHPSRADWPPSYSYRGRIGFTLRYGSRVRLASPPAPSLEPALARLRAEQAIYTMNSFQFIRSTRLILAYPTNGRRQVSWLFPEFATADPPCFHSHSPGSILLRCQFLSSIHNGCCHLSFELNVSVRKLRSRTTLAVTRTRRLASAT